MGFVEINRDPSGRELRVFGLIWLLFLGALGALVLWKPAGLLGASAFLGLAWVASLAFNRDDRRGQLAGAAIPIVFAALGGSVTLGVPPVPVAAACWAVAALGALGIWLSPALGRRLYVGWMLAVLPIGWTISNLVLAIVYYLVLTPIGVIMRLSGYDPLRRRFDRSAETYWVERRSDTPPERYFRQF